MKPWLSDLLLVVGIALIVLGLCRLIAHHV